MSPSLTPDDRVALLGPLRGVRCVVCCGTRIQHYCRSCDEFFITCHCAQTLLQHTDHRVYIWTRDRGILALPNFD